MKKANADPKVKKTLIRNYEQRVLTERKAVHEVEAGPSKSNTISRKQKENIKLDQPTLCSSEALANYLSDVQKRHPSPIISDEVNVDKAEISSKITKKLNFHFNDRIYKNLVELNADAASLQSKKDKKPQKIKNLAKKDLEPCIEDFCQDDIDKDMSPNIPVIKQKFKPIKQVEDGRLHRLIATFEKL